MRTNKTRLAAVSGATLALVVATTATVAAHPGNDRDRGLGPRMGGMQRGFDDGQLGDRFGRQFQRGLPGGMLGGLRGAFGDLERREVTLQTADGITVQRIEQGTVDSVSDTSLSFTLGSGEAVTVAIDEDTSTIAFSEQEVTSRRGLSRTLQVPSEVPVTDIEAGAEIAVWSDSEDGADFVAQRIVVQPVQADAADASDATDASASDDSAASVTDESATTPVTDA